MNEYYQTFTGRLVRTYGHMQKRTKKGDCNHPELYLGKYLLPRERFYQWARRSSRYKKLFNTWKNAGFPLLLTPTIDRKNSNRGYHVDNIQWLTFKDNCAKSAKVRKRGKR